MENAKMWFGLVKQMIYEIVILFLLYLFVGNNFGNNIFAIQKIQPIIDNILASDIATNVFSHPIVNIIVYFLLVPIAIIYLFLLFSPFWFPLSLTFTLLSDKTLKSCAKVFGGQYPADAAPKIEKWYKQSRIVRIIFIIITRILFITFILIKGINAPKDYTAYFNLFEWNMSGGLMGILIIISGALTTLLSASAGFSKLHFNMEELCKHTCPNCHKIAWVKKTHKVQTQRATYGDRYTISSGYYTRDVIGEVVDSAGNHVGDVEGDVWVDTSTSRAEQLTPDIFEIRAIYAPCGCEETIKTIEKKL